MDVTVVIVHFQTPDLLTIAVESFVEFYPKIPVLIIDNGSKDNSGSVIRNLCDNYNNVSSHFLDTNIFHGPAMDFAAKNLVKTDFIFFLDSDTETKKGLFMEDMNAYYYEDDSLYGVGEFNRVNKRGFKNENGNVILQTPYMLLKRDVYNSLPPFIHHGQPTMQNFIASWEKGCKLREFPISRFIDHKWRGTAERFGYGLGWRGKLDYILNKLGL